MYNYIVFYIYSKTLQRKPMKMNKIGLGILNRTDANV